MPGSKGNEQTEQFQCLHSTHRDHEPSPRACTHKRGRKVPNQISMSSLQVQGPGPPERRVNTPSPSQEVQQKAEARERQGVILNMSGKYIPWGPVIPVGPKTSWHPFLCSLPRGPGDGRCHQSPETCPIPQGLCDKWQPCDSIVQPTNCVCIFASSFLQH